MNNTLKPLVCKHKNFTLNWNCAAWFRRPIWDQWTSG